MGTLRVPDVIPSPTQDCERLHKAFKGFSFYPSQYICLSVYVYIDII